MPPSTRCRDIPGDSYHRLPERAAIDRLKEAAAAYYGAPDTSNLALAPGSQALIQWLPRLRPQSQVAVIAPTYQEHRHSWELAGHEVNDHADLAAARAAGPDVIIVVHPNNPTGLLHDEKQLLEVAAELSERDGWLVLDEAFGDVVPDRCLDRHAGHPGLVILRSFGKFFGLAGIRLGIAVTDAGLATELESAMGPWVVPGPTLEIATQAYRDRDWIAGTRMRLSEDARRMDHLLEAIGCVIAGGTDLYRLVENGRAAGLLNHLGNRGIMLRPFDYNETWLRFGLPGNETDWQRLESALSEYHR